MLAVDDYFALSGAASDRTFRALSNTDLDIGLAFAKLQLRILQILVRAAQVLNFLIKLLLHLYELLGRKACQIDYEVGSEAAQYVHVNDHSLCWPFSPPAAAILH